MLRLLDAFCITLLILTPLSYLPLNRNIASSLADSQTNGISITAALLLALCAQSQVATMYYLWACPPFKKWGEVVPKPPRKMDCINLAQIITQWICAVGFLLFLLRWRNTSVEFRDVPVDPDTDPNWPPPPQESAFPSDKMAQRLLVSHAALCVFWAYLAGSPTKDWLDLPFVLIMSANACIVNIMILIATIVAMGLQIDATRNTSGPSAFTRAAVGLQALVFLGLAVSWWLRFKVPENLSRGWGRLWWTCVWYPLVGWACMNNAIVAIGLGVVALCAGSG